MNLKQEKPKTNISWGILNSFSSLALSLVFFTSLKNFTELPPIFVFLLSVFFGTFISGRFLNVIKQKKNEIDEDIRLEPIIPPEPKRVLTIEEEISIMVASSLDAIQDSVLIIDSEQRLLFANKTARERFNARTIYSRIEFYLRDPEILNNISQSIKTIEPKEFILETHFPETRFDTISISPFMTDNTSKFIITIRDETDIRNAQKNRSEFLANAGHELRTPLASIVGFLETISETAKDDEKARNKFIGIMKKQADRMIRLVNDILALSRIELDEHLPPSGNFDIKEITNFSINSLEPIISANDNKIICDFNEENLCVKGDKEQVQQVITNLIDNAVKYGAAKTNIKIIIKQNLKAEEASKIANQSWKSSSYSSLCIPLEPVGKLYTIFRIENEGLGIEKQYMARLSERFYRIDNNIQGKSGTGLGLAIVKHIIMRHKGGFHVESIEGKATAFSFYFPQ